MTAGQNADMSALKTGIILGLLYCVFIFVQNQFFYSNPLQFAVVKGICYILILVGIFYTGYSAKKDNGGFITFQDCLKVMLITIAVLELIYLIFNLIYVKFIDPTFIDKMKAASLAFFEKAKMPEEDINKQMERFKEAGKITAWTIIQSYGFALIIDAVFAVIFAAILKNNKPVFENPAS